MGQEGGMCEAYTLYSNGDPDLFGQCMDGQKKAVTGTDMALLPRT